MGIESMGPWGNFIGRFLGPKEKPLVPEVASIGRKEGKKAGDAEDQTQSGEKTIDVVDLSGKIPEDDELIEGDTYDARGRKK